MKRVCRTCKHKPNCEFFVKGREDWTCMSYTEADNCQITLYDYYIDNFSIGAQYRREGYTNVYDAMPNHECKVNVIDHEGNRFKMQAVLSFGSMAFTGRDRGYGICWWKEEEG